MGRRRMLEPQPLRSLERHPALEPVAVYERDVAAPVAAVWENVHDWEHLPWLHDQAFASIDLRECGEWGWHVDVGFPDGSEAEIELVIDAAAGCYVARTRTGDGAPGETWTTLTPTGADRTAVHVEFLQPPMPDAAREKVGAGYRKLYETLWDQDVEMIEVRESTAPGVRPRVEAPAVLELGDWATFRAKLPLSLDFGGHRFRVVLRAGRPLAYAAECPHWRGPLDACEIDAGGGVVCPWHGYRFDVETGRSLDDRGLRLRPAPSVEIDEATGRVRLVRQAGA